jgi:hypothetical protein
MEQTGMFRTLLVNMAISEHLIETSLVIDHWKASMKREGDPPQRMRPGITGSALTFESGS